MARAFGRTFFLMFAMSIRVVSCLVVLFSCLVGCAAPESAPIVAAPTAAPSYYVGGHVTGLKGVGLVLRTANGDHATVTADGEFAFTVPLRNGASYTVSIDREPISPLQSCTVDHAAGRIRGKNTDEISVTCSTVEFVFDDAASDRFAVNP